MAWKYWRDEFAARIEQISRSVGRAKQGCKPDMKAHYETSLLSSKEKMEHIEQALFHAGSWTANSDQVRADKSTATKSRQLDQRSKHRV